MRAICIKWDTDGDVELLKTLPTEIEIPEGFTGEIYDYLSNQTGFCCFSFKLDEIDRLQDIQEIEKLNDNLPDGNIVDADTLLADLMQEIDFEISGIAQEIFNIWKESKDKKSVEEMFLAFTGETFEEYLETCKRKIGKETYVQSGGYRYDRPD